MILKSLLSAFLTLSIVFPIEVNSIKALKILQENGKISKDCILMVDEVYLEKATQYHNGNHQFMFLVG